jgi:chemotaxis protein methyltransferase CheR
VSVQERIRALLAASIGVELPGGPNLALDAFVRERSEALGLSAPEAYVNAIGGPTSPEFQRLVNAVTVKYTWFFRDLPQIQAIRQLMREPRTEALHVWVPGCASGEDAYTIALLARECGADVRILATDVSSEAIERARSGHYGAWSTRDVPPELHRYFVPVARGALAPTSELRARVRFEVHNLLAVPPVPSNGRGWDVILCRNVLMYFSQEKAQATAGTLTRALSEDGHLLLGASDVLIERPPDACVEYVAGRVALRRQSKEERAGHASRAGRDPSPAARAPAPPPAVPSAPPVTAPSVEPESLLGAAHVYLSVGKIDLALRAYVSACEAEPVSTEPRLYAGIAHYLSGDLPQALGALRAALLLDHRCWPASYYLGLCYESMGHARDAEREYERAALQSEREPPTSEDPTSPLFGFRRDLAWLAKRRGRPRPAAL